MSTQNRWTSHFVFTAAMLFIVLLLFRVDVSYGSNCGEAMPNGTWKSVIGYSNEPYQGTGTSCAGIGTFGYQYQCVELIKRFYNSAGIKTTSWPSVPDNKQTFFDNAASYGLTSYPNNGASPPKVNDI